MDASLITPAPLPDPPIATRLPQKIVLHGDERIDEYGWLRDKASAATLAYLEAENAYADAVMKPTEELQERLYAEMLGRIRQTDSNVPYRKNGHFYYSRTIEGEQYPVHARRKDEAGAPEEIILDVNQLAAGKSYMSIGAMSVSDDGRWLAFSTDETGYRVYTLHVKDLRSGKVVSGVAEKVGGVDWAADDRTIFYTVENESKREYRLYRHVFGSSAHTLVFEEDDDLYDLWMERSRSGAFLFVTSDSKTTNEVRLIPAGEPEALPRVIAPRRGEHKYYADHHGELLYLMTNDAGINYRVVSAPVASCGEANWVEVVPWREPVHIESIDVFRDHLVVTLREGGLSHFEIYELSSGESHRVSFPEPAYAVFADANEEFDTRFFRFRYQSFVTPPSTWDYDMSTREQKLLKQNEILGGYDPSNYRVDRFFVAASDGAQIPVALVCRREIDPRAKNPMLLYAYGSYGASMPDGFSSGRFSLIDRGVVYAIAHVRGGGEMGKEWHDQGRMMVKNNTFTDFITVAEHLVSDGYTTPENLAIQGGSAGGLLVGAVVNMRPELFGAALAQVPFVDVVNTMLDATLPLTTQEYIEWGNPNEREAYFYMKSYDPYSNVAAHDYPAMLVRTSLNDSQVGYWEAAKWVARLRAVKTDDNVLLLRVNMGAGHGGASGRYDRMREDAHDYAFLLTQWQIRDRP